MKGEQSWRRKCLGKTRSSVGEPFRHLEEGATTLGSRAHDQVHPPVLCYGFLTRWPGGTSGFH